MGGMTGSLLLLLWAGVSVSTMVDLQKRINNGKKCGKLDRQYHVTLNIVTKTGGTGFCGASLISDEWILTAAHCWEPRDDKAITAKLRVHPRGKEVHESIDVGNIHQHDKADIMLLKLTKPATGFKHIELPDCVYNPTPKKGTKVQIAGHGSTTIGPDGKRIHTLLDHLHCGDIEVEDCPLVREQHEFCGKTDNSKKAVDSCYGDSGGGVVYKDRLYGVIGGSVKIDCSRSAVFTDVCGYWPWIIQITRTLPPPKKLQ